MDLHPELQRRADRIRQRMATRLLLWAELVEFGKQEISDDVKRINEGFKEKVCDELRALKFDYDVLLYDFVDESSKGTS